MKKVKNKIKKDKSDELSGLKAKAEENMAGWQRAKADYINLQKEMEQKLSAVRDYAKISLLGDLVSILDNFNKAVIHVPKEQEKENWVVGIFHIKKQFEDFLTANGLEKVETIGQEFDPNLHEAVGEEESAEKKGIIIKEVSSGYKLNNQVIIPAKVIVAK